MEQPQQQPVQPVEPAAPTRQLAPCLKCRNEGADVYYTPWEWHALQYQFSKVTQMSEEQALSLESGIHGIMVSVI